MADPLLITVLAIGHILSAIGWLGASLLTGFVIGPGLQKLSAPSRLEFIAKLNPKILNYVRGMIVGTFAFGLLLLYFFYDGDFSVVPQILMAGIAMAVVTAVLAFAVIFPSFSRLASIADGVLKSEGQPPPPEMMKYAKRARISSMVGALLLLVVVAMMVAAGFY